MLLGGLGFCGCLDVFTIGVLVVLVLGAGGRLEVWKLLFRWLELPC